MTDKELLERATEFDAGPPAIINGQLWRDDFADSHHHYVRVVQRLNAHTGKKKWAIHDGFRDLNRHGHWETALRGSRTNEPYLKRCRFDTAQEALEFWFRYRAAVVAWATKKLAKAKEGERVILNPPQKLKF